MERVLIIHTVNGVPNVTINDDINQATNFVNSDKCGKIEFMCEMGKVLEVKQNSDEPGN